MRTKFLFNLNTPGPDGKLHNARLTPELMASAPELLAVCKMLLYDMEQKEDKDLANIDLLKRVINKAEGLDQLNLRGKE